MSQAVPEYGALAQANPYHPAPTVRAAYVMQSLAEAAREGAPLDFAPGTTPAHLADALGVRSVEYVAFVGTTEQIDLGQYDSKTDRIQILRPEERTEPGTASAEHSLLHELAHAAGRRNGRTDELLASRAADLARGIPESEASPATVRLHLREEVTAEATASILAERLGVPSRTFSMGYITENISEGTIKLSPEDLDLAVQDASRAAREIHGAYLEYSRHPERVLATDIAARDRLDEDATRLSALGGSADHLEIRSAELRRVARSLGEGEEAAQKAARIFAEPDAVVQGVRKAGDFGAQERYLQGIEASTRPEGRLVPAREPGLTGLIGGKSEAASRAALPEALRTLREYGREIRAARQAVENAKSAGREVMQDLPAGDRARIEPMKLPARVEALRHIAREKTEVLDAHVARAERVVPSRASLQARLSELSPAKQAWVQARNPGMQGPGTDGPKMAHAAARSIAW